MSGYSPLKVEAGKSGRFEVIITPSSHGTHSGVLTFSNIPLVDGGESDERPYVVWYGLTINVRPASPETNLEVCVSVEMDILVGMSIP